MTTMQEILERALARRPPPPVVKVCRCGARHNRPINICTKCLRARSMKSHRTIKMMTRARAVAKQPPKPSTARDMLNSLMARCGVPRIG